MTPKQKEILRDYFKAIDLDNWNPKDRSKLQFVKACIGFVTNPMFEKVAAFYPFCFGDEERNKVNLIAGIIQ